MNIHVKLFGMLSDAAGCSEIQLHHVHDTDSLKQKLISDFPKLKDMSFVIAISKCISGKNQKLNDGDTVVLLPPFAGG